MSRRKRTPHDPAAAARLALERAEREAEIKRLQDQGVIVSLDNRRQIISARRSNVFRLLLERRSITESQYDAAYRLSLDWAAWKGLDGKPDGPTPDRVDEEAPKSRSLVNDRMLKAGGRVAAALRHLLRPERIIIEAMMEATVEQDRAMVWRGIVEREVGLTNKVAQTRLVIDALEALRTHYEGTNHKMMCPPEQKAELVVDGPIR